jgi:hypothetical protein
MRLQPREQEMNPNTRTEMMAALLLISQLRGQQKMGFKVDEIMRSEAGNLPLPIRNMLSFTFALARVKPIAVDQLRTRTGYAPICLLYAISLGQPLLFTHNRDKTWNFLPSTDRKERNIAAGVAVNGVRLPG